MDVEAHRALCIAFMKCLESLDFRGAEDLTTPQTIFWDAVRGEMMQPDYLGAVEAFSVHYASPLSLTLLSSTAEEDRVSLEMEGRVELTSGQVYSNRYNILFRVRDGKIVRCNEYLDTAHVHEVVQSLREA